MTNEETMHDLMVENNLKYHLDIKDSLYPQSTFIKITSNDNKFSLNKVYLGSRTCKSEAYGCIEETIAYYVAEIDEENKTLCGFVVYYELTPKNSNTFYIEKYYPPYSGSWQSIVINDVSSISIKTHRYRDFDLNFEDDIGISITSKNETEIKGWWRC